MPWDVAQIPHRRTVGDAFARVLEAAFHDHVPLAMQPVGAAPLRVLQPANMPAVLLEMGYLTNPDQEKQLAGADFQNTLVQALVDAVVKFRDAMDDERRAAALQARRSMTAAPCSPSWRGCCSSRCLVLIVIVRQPDRREHRSAGGREAGGRRRRAARSRRCCFMCRWTARS